MQGPQVFSITGMKNGCVERCFELPNIKLDLIEIISTIITSENSDQELNIINSLCVRQNQKLIKVTTVQIQGHTLEIRTTLSGTRYNKDESETLNKIHQKHHQIFTDFATNQKKKIKSKKFQKQSENHQNDKKKQNKKGNQLLSQNQYSSKKLKLTKDSLLIKFKEWLLEKSKLTPSYMIYVETINGLKKDNKCPKKIIQCFQNDENLSTILLQFADQINDVNQKVIVSLVLKRKIQQIANAIRKSKSQLSIQQLNEEEHKKKVAQIEEWLDCANFD